MFTHPYLAGQLARERQRGLLAQAGQQRLARRLRGLARASRRAARAPRRVARLVNRRRAVLPS